MENKGNYLFNKFNTTTKIFHLKLYFKLTLLNLTEFSLLLTLNDEMNYYFYNQT